MKKNTKIFCHLGKLQYLCSRKFKIGPFVYRLGREIFIL